MVTDQILQSHKPIILTVVINNNSISTELYDLLVISDFSALYPAKNNITLLQSITTYIFCNNWCHILSCQSSTIHADRPWWKHLVECLLLHKSWDKQCCQQSARISLLSLSVFWVCIYDLVTSCTMQARVEPKLPWTSVRCVKLEVVVQKIHLLHV